MDGLVDAAARAALGSTRLDRPAGQVGRVTVFLKPRDDQQPDGHRDRPGRGENADPGAGPVRACFRLVEPPAEQDQWQVAFALQATDEQSLVVEADAVWRSRGKLPALARHLDSPQETFLAELGKASRLYADLDGALRTARPTGLTRRLRRVDH